MKRKKQIQDFHHESRQPALVQNPPLLPTPDYTWFSLMEVYVIHSNFLVWICFCDKKIFIRFLRVLFLTGLSVSERYTEYLREFWRKGWLSSSFLFPFKMRMDSYQRAPESSELARSLRLLEKLTAKGTELLSEPQECLKVLGGWMGIWSPCRASRVCTSTGEDPWCLDLELKEKSFHLWHYVDQKWGRISGQMPACSEDTDIGTYWFPGIV